MNHEKTTIHHMFKTAKQMAEISGIGCEALRRMVNQNEIDYVPIGNRKLITEQAMWDWYERNKVPAKTPDATQSPKVKVAIAKTRRAV